MNSNNQKNTTDLKLLQRLLLSPIKRPTKTQSINAFLSHPMWQGIGVLISLLSLIVTIILTMYIYNLGQDQGIAHIQATLFLNSIPEDLAVDTSQSNVHSRQIINIYNSGPSVGEAVVVSILSAREIHCQEVPPNGYQEDVATKIISKNGRCDLFFDNLYPEHIASIYVEEFNSLVPKTTSSELDIQENDGIWWTISGKNISLSQETYNANQSISPPRTR